MIPRYLLDSDPEMKKMVINSLIFHVSIVLLFTIQHVIFPSTNIEYQSAMKIDLIGLPDKKIPEPAPQPKVEEKKVELPAPPTKTAEKSNKKTTDALKKLKRLEAFESLKNLKEEKSNTAETESKPIKGNQVVPGTALRGLTRMEFDGYIEQLDSHIKKHWALPEWLSRSNFKARINVKIDNAGLVIEKSFKEASGNEEFDRRVLAAVEAASPFPLPPEKFQALLKVDGVTFGFPE